MGSLQNYAPGLKSKTIFMTFLILIPPLALGALSTLYLFFPKDLTLLYQTLPAPLIAPVLFVISLVSFIPIFRILRTYREGLLSYRHLQSGTIPALVTDKKGAILFANPEFQKLFPDARAHIEDLIPYLYTSDIREPFQTFLKDIQSNFQQEFDTEKSSFTFSLESGEPQCYRFSCAPYKKNLFWTLINEDKNNRTSFFQETPFQRALNATYLFNSTPSGNVVLDHEGKIQGINETFKKNFLKDHKATVGSSFLTLLTPSCVKDLSNDIISVLKTKKSGGALELEFSWGDNVIAYVTPLNFKDMTKEYEGYYLQIFDNSEQRNIQLRLTHSQKLQALGQLAGGIAHDFNNLLTAMIGFCDLLLMRLSPGDQSFTDIMQIKQNANRATNLVRQLLAFSRQQTLQPTVLDVSEVLSDLSILLQRLIGSRIELKIIHDRAVDFIKVDCSQFEQVIVNLVVNAKDAIIGEGTVRIITKLQKFDTPTTVDHETLPAGNYIQIEVIDDGQGISRKNLERVFDPFFSTKDVGEGTGLGLSTVYGTVKQTGGHISVDSTVGVGTKFTILLPQYRGIKQKNSGEKESQQNIDHLPSPFKDLTGQGHILIAEDEDAVRLFAARALSDKGYKVDQAQNGVEALKILKAMHKAGEKAPDLLITDVVMPKADGPTLVKEAQKFYPEMKVMYISGYAEDAFRDMVRLEEKIRFLAKPFSLKVLAARVKETLESPLEKPIDPSSPEEDNTVDLVKYRYDDSNLNTSNVQESESKSVYNIKESSIDDKSETKRSAP
ncbi:MAG: response regulator [Alphaproteobacteria bacterium]|nr:response regulator [Alphaproteobacteria bacterium]NCQ66754.1 response regulator [Alphaproteobacteria bacterium]